MRLCFGLFYVGIALLFFSCQSAEEEGLAEQPKPVILDSLQQEVPVEVKTFVLGNTPFYRELVANGKIYSPQKADVHFAASGDIIAVRVVEGQFVKKGELIAQLEDSEWRTALQQAQLDYRRSALDYEDQLLQLGYRMSDTAQLDLAIRQVAKLRSGYAHAEIAFAKAKDALLKANLHAPFDGVIANLKAKAFNPSSSVDVVCSVIATQSLQFEFKVLEQELPFVQASKSLVIIPFSAPERTYAGKVLSINPVVDSGGMLTVKAVVQGDRYLLDGMSAQVLLRELVPDVFNVPKEAVLDRQGRKVVFTAADGRARWNYVDIVQENSTHYALSKGLSLGDEVIVEGNFNLAHDRSIRVVN